MCVGAWSSGRDYPTLHGPILNLDSIRTAFTVEQFLGGSIAPRLYVDKFYYIALDIE